MEAFAKEQISKDMHVKDPQALLQVMFATYEIHLRLECGFMNTVAMHCTAVK